MISAIDILKNKEIPQRVTKVLWGALMSLMSMAHNNNPSILVHLNLAY